MIGPIWNAGVWSKEKMMRFKPFKFLCDHNDEITSKVSFKIFTIFRDIFKKKTPLDWIDKRQTAQKSRSSFNSIECTCIIAHKGNVWH